MKSREGKSISKSDYIRGLQCSKALWFFNYRKDLKLPLDDKTKAKFEAGNEITCLLYTSPSPRDRTRSRMPSSA